MYTRTTKCIIEVFVLCALCTVQPATVISGNALLQGATFNFAIKKYAKGLANNTFFVAADQNAGGFGKVRDFAITRLQNDAVTFEPLAPEKVTININNLDQPNPIFDAGIRELALLENSSQGLLLPAAVTQNLPNVIFLYETAEQKNTSLLQSLPLRDARNRIGKQLFGLTTDNNARVFSMIQPVDADFGQLGTGIVGMIRGTLQSEKQLRVFSQIDLPTGNILETDLVRAFPFDITSEALKIGAQNLSAFASDIVSLHWDSVLHRLFIGLQVRSGTQTDSGARSIAVARLENNKLLISPIAPNSVFDALHDKIVGVANRASTTVAVHSLKTMHTSTGISYLIVRGGVGDPAVTAQEVYAMPLVSGSSEDLNGTIAAIDAIPADVFMPGPSSVPLFVQRQLTVASTSPENFPRVQDASVTVGGGPLNAGTITDMFIQGDSIFVVVENQGAGVYYSRAIFASDGKIKGWTDWQSTQATAESVFGAVINGSDISTTFITQDAAGLVNTVKRTSWVRSDENNFAPAAQAINNFFETNSAGITSAGNFTPKTPGVVTSSIWYGGGDGMLALAQTGFVDAITERLIPLRGDDFGKAQTFDKGTISADVTGALLFIQGGVLDTIGAVTTVDIAVSQESNQAWLVVGGVGGVAILSASDGAGWDGLAGIAQLSHAFKKGMSFKKVGNYSLVNKVIAEGDYLYILTNTTLDRINIATLNGGLGSARAVTLASLTSLGLPSTGALRDLIVSQSLALLATSNMLFRVVDEDSIQRLNGSQIRWQRIALAQGLTSVTQLVAVTPTGRAQDITRGVGANVLVLGADQGNDQAVVNRLVVAPLASDQAVNAETVALLPDIVVQNTPSNFLTFGMFVDEFITDGAVYMTRRDAQQTENSLVQIVSFATPPRTGKPSIGIAMQPIKTLASLGRIITSLQRNVASGAWVITGDFGLRINE